MLNKAAPHKGPLLNWDPDIVETLDDEFQHGEQNVYKLKDLEKLMEAEDEICNSSDEENALDMILAKAQGENELSDIGTKNINQNHITYIDTLIFTAIILKIVSFHDFPIKAV